MSNPGQDYENDRMLDNVSDYNKAINLAMPWTAKLASMKMKKIETCTEYGTVYPEENNKGSKIL